MVVEASVVGVGISVVAQGTSVVLIVLRSVVVVSNGVVDSDAKIFVQIISICANRKNIVRTITIHSKKLPKIRTTHLK